MNASLPPLPACSKQKSQFNKQTIYFLSASVSEKLAAHSWNRLFKYVIISEFTLCSHISRLLQHHSICMKEIEIRRGKGARGKKMFIFCLVWRHFPLTYISLKLSTFPNWTLILSIHKKLSGNQFQKVVTIQLYCEYIFCKSSCSICWKRGRYKSLSHHSNAFFLFIFQTPKQLFDWIVTFVSKKSCLIHKNTISICLSSQV